jgi:amidase
MPMSDLCFLTAVELAKLIRAGQLSAREVMQATSADRARQPAGERHPHTLARTGVSWRRRRDEAQARGEPLGPLHGLPIAHKDLVPTRGIRTTWVRQSIGISCPIRMR